MKQGSRRAARLRDNKRRNRQRQKDYTASLETKLRELQSQGVQATQEVQLSARKVVADNARLKALLRHVGVDDQVIETWTPHNVAQSLPALSECDKKAGKCIRKVSLSLDLIPGSAIKAKGWTERRHFWWPSNPARRADCSPSRTCSAPCKGLSNRVQRSEGQ